MNLPRHTYLETVEPSGSAGTSASDIPPPPSLHFPSEGRVEMHVFFKKSKTLEDLCLRKGVPEADPKVRIHIQVIY